MRARPGHVFRPCEGSERASALGRFPRSPCKSTTAPRPCGEPRAYGGGHCGRPGCRCVPARPRHYARDEPFHNRAHKQKVGKRPRSYRATKIDTLRRDGRSGVRLLTPARGTNTARRWRRCAVLGSTPGRLATQLREQRPPVGSSATASATAGGRARAGGVQTAPHRAPATSGPPPADRELGGTSGAAPGAERPARRRHAITAERQVSDSGARPAGGAMTRPCSGVPV